MDHLSDDLNDRPTWQSKGIYYVNPEPEVVTVGATSWRTSPYDVLRGSRLKYLNYFSAKIPTRVASQNFRTILQSAQRALLRYFLSP